MRRALGWWSAGSTPPQSASWCKQEHASAVHRTACMSEKIANSEGDGRMREGKELLKFTAIGHGTEQHATEHGAQASA